MQYQAYSAVDQNFLQLSMIEIVRSKNTEKTTIDYLLKDSLLEKTITLWGTQRQVSKQEIPLTPKHYEDLSAYFQLSWENLQGEFLHPILKGNLGKTSVEIESVISWEGEKISLQVRGMKGSLLKDEHYLSARLLSEYLDRYFTDPKSFRALEWIKG